LSELLVMGKVYRNTWRDTWSIRTIGVSSRQDIKRA